MLVIHLGFCKGDVLNRILTDMSLNKKREISAIEPIRLGIPVEDGKWADTLHFFYSLISHYLNWRPPCWSHDLSAMWIFLH